MLLDFTVIYMYESIAAYTCTCVRHLKLFYFNFHIFNAYNYVLSSG